MVENPKQWRIEIARHIKGAPFQFRSWVRPSERWDHDHCEGCWAKFAEFDGPNIQHEGYAASGRMGELWVCRECFDDLKDDSGLISTDLPLLKSQRLPASTCDNELVMDRLFAIGASIA